MKNKRGRGVDEAAALPSPMKTDVFVNLIFISHIKSVSEDNDCSAAQIKWLPNAGYTGGDYILL